MGEQRRRVVQKLTGCVKRNAYSHYYDGWLCDDRTGASDNCVVYDYFCTEEAVGVADGYKCGANSYVRSVDEACAGSATYWEIYGDCGKRRRRRRGGDSRRRGGPPMVCDSGKAGPISCPSARRLSISSPEALPLPLQRSNANLTSTSSKSSPDRLYSNISSGAVPLRVGVLV